MRKYGKLVHGKDLTGGSLGGLPRDALGVPNEQHLTRLPELTVSAAQKCARPNEGEL